MTNQPTQDFALIGETSTFTRIPSKDGELLEVKMHIRARTPVGVSHENIQTVVLAPAQSAAISAGLKMLHSQVQAIVATEVARQAEEAKTPAETAQADPQAESPTTEE